MGDCRPDQGGDRQSRWGNRLWVAPRERKARLMRVRTVSGEVTRFPACAGSGAGGQGNGSGDPGHPASGSHARVGPRSVLLGGSRALCSAGTVRFWHHSPTVGRPCPPTERSASLALSSWSEKKFHWYQIELPISCKKIILSIQVGALHGDRTADSKHGIVSLQGPVAHSAIAKKPTSEYTLER